MRYKRITLTDKTSDLEYEDTANNVVLSQWLRYPNNSILHEQTYKKLLNNIDEIPIQEIQDLLEKYNCM